MDDIEAIKARLDICKLKVRTAHQVHLPEIELDGDQAHVIWAMQDRVIWGRTGRRSPAMAIITNAGCGGTATGRSPPCD